MRVHSRIVLAVLSLILFAPAAQAASCWTTPRDWSVIPQGIVTFPMLNTDVRDNTNCLKTEVNTDGTITRDVVLFTSGTSAGNVGAGATLVNTYSMPAGKIATDGDSLEITSGFSCTANANTKTVDFVIGSQAIQTSSSACNGTVLVVRFTLFRKSNTTQSIYGNTVASGLGAVTFASDAFTQTLSNALSVGFRLTATSNNDVVQSWVRIVHSRHP